MADYAELIEVEAEGVVDIQTAYEMGGGIVPSGTKNINITTNGVTTEDVTEYASAKITVNVPSSGITPTGTKSIGVGAAGTITEDVTQYANVSVTTPQGGYDPYIEIDATPTLSLNSSTGVVTASVSAEATDTNKSSFTEGYVESADVSATAEASGSATLQLSTQSGTTIIPSTSQQTAVASGKYTTGNVLVDPIPSQYIIPTGTKSITQNGTGIDVSQYASVDVNVSVGGGVTLEDVMNKNVSGNISLNITNQPTPPNNANGAKYFNTTFNGLFIDNTTVTGLTVNGLKWVPSQILRDATGVTTVSFPDALFAGARAFNGANHLVSASLPNLLYGYSNYTDLTQYMFGGCTLLTSVDIGSVGRLGNFMFQNCTALTMLDIKATDLQGNCFSGCTALNTLIIRTSSVPTLNNISAFTNTPFASGKSGGTLYVPSALISSYQSETNWSTILGYANNNIVAIEGSQYE